jgi:P27 family predicted phage terminase small subunit
MGLRGPQPKPTAAKVLEGTYRPDRAPINEAAAEGKPVCPTWMSKEAKQEWQRIVPSLIAAGLAGRIDRNALARYCVLWVRWRQAEAMIQRTGEVVPIRDESGKVKFLQPSPYVSIARSLADQLYRLEQGFGMCPSARSRINVAPTPAHDELEQFLRS